MNINYRRIFLLASIAIIFTPLILRVDKIGDPVVTFNPLHIHMQYILGYCFFSLPFFVLATMSVYWAWIGPNMSEEDFYCRIGGGVTIYLLYTSGLIALIALACAGSTPIGAILYPVSIPIVFPILYYIGISLVKKIYNK